MSHSPLANTSLTSKAFTTSVSAKQALIHLVNVPMPVLISTKHHSVIVGDTSESLSLRPFPHLKLTRLLKHKSFSPSFDLQDETCVIMKSNVIITEVICRVFPPPSGHS